MDVGSVPRSKTMHSAVPPTPRPWHLSRRYIESRRRPASRLSLVALFRRRVQRGVDVVDQLLRVGRSGGLRSGLALVRKRFASGRRRGRNAPLEWSAQGADAPAPIGFRQLASPRVITLHKRRDVRLARRLDRATAVVPGAIMSMDAVVRLAGSGVALAGGSTRIASASLPSIMALDRLVRSVEPTELVDPRRRELHSVRLRRLAARVHREAAGNRPAPDVAILLATNRPNDLEHCVEQIVGQSVRPAQVVVGLHGDEWTAEHRDRLVDVFADRAIVRFCASELNLGQVLNELSDAATAEFVTKWDDDDWYGRHHIEDLLVALSYSGADIVGKAAEFVRFEEMDVTIRRFRSGAETYSRTLAGGTLLLRRSTLQRVGRWAPIPRDVDRALIDAVLAAGGSVYRTHGFEYVLRRRSGHHTWSAPDEYFLTGGIDSRPGLDLDFAGIDR